MELQLALFNGDNQFFSEEPYRTDTDNFILVANQIKPFYTEDTVPNTIITIETLADDPNKFLERGGGKGGMYPGVYIYPSPHPTIKKEKCIVFPIDSKKGKMIFDSKKGKMIFKK